MTSLLMGVSEYFSERDCYVQHFLDDPVPHIKVKRHGTVGFVECQFTDGRLLMAYRRGEPRFMTGSRPIIGSPCRKIDLSEPNSLSVAFNYIKKHLFKKVYSVKGGLNDRPRETVQSSIGGIQGDRC